MMPLRSNKPRSVMRRSASSPTAATGAGAGSADDPSADSASSSLNSSFLNRWHSNTFASPAGDPQVTTLLGGGQLTTTGLLSATEAATADQHYDTAGIPTRPRRLWKVSDTHVPAYPAYWPKPVLFVPVTGTSPAVVAIRIAECLTKRSVAAEYDDEAASVVCQTADRCLFTVQLWHREAAIWVECVRISGGTLTFHQHARAILLAAQSLDSGADRRAPHQCSATEYPRLRGESSTTAATTRNNILQQPPSSRATMEEVATTAVEALEQAFQLLCKDRLDAQLIGLQSLVNLTDPVCTGVPVAQYAALGILGGAPLLGSESVLLHQIHTDWILGLLLGHVPGEEVVVGGTGGATGNAPLDNNAGTASFSGSARVLDRPDEADTMEEDEGGSNIATIVPDSASNDTMMAKDEDDKHASHMRALVLRAFVNALSVLADHQPATLQSVLSTQAPDNVSGPVLDALCRDLRGASRPVSAPGRLASPHEAALAVKALGLLALHSVSAKRTLSKDESLLEELEKVAAIGRATHLVLAAEARRTYHALTEEDRSC